METTVAAATQWHNQDPDRQTQAELGALLESHAAGNLEAAATLSELFGGRLAFGTAGIRGPLQPGPRGMNRVVIGQTTAGLAQYLLEHRSTESGKTLRVVVGCDARTNSDIFAADTAAIMAGYGLEAIALPEKLPTPVLAFAVRYLNADAGVMVTASHNPPQDNGYKVYLGGADEGSQIIPPVDSDIEKLIAGVARSISWADIPRSPEAVIPAPEDIVAQYVAATVASVAPEAPQDPPLSVVYTAMHGVGAGTFFETVEAAGFPSVHPVTEQTEPDAAFPTVAFPNPEEHGALDLSIATAKKHDAALIIAHDPDADRLALALPRGGDYIPLTGNQVGAILGWHCAKRAHKTGVTGMLANSLVSSPVLGKIAKHFGLEHEETLTGFKYVSRVPDLIFGFEEALGYLVTPDVVRDKDGVSAGLMALEIAYSLAAEKRTLWDYLATIEESVGGFASSQITIKLGDQGNNTPLAEQLRSTQPGAFGTRAITQVDDFLQGVGKFPREDILRYYLDDGSRVIIRPSGTEPKLKIYLDTQGDTRREAETSLTDLESALRSLVDDLP
ncbi:MAG: phospho-sugar mutase [Actinomycetales bacterium]